MKSTEYYWDHPELQVYVKSYPEGNCLFKEGESGGTMFIVVQGIVQLMAKSLGASFPLSTISAGDFLGEKAIMSDSPHRRYFTALAKTDVKALEIGLNEIGRIEQKTPGLMTDLLRRMFQLAAQRLDRANELTRALRSSDNAERIVALLIHFAKASGRTNGEGTEFLLSPHSLRYYTDMDTFQIEESLKALEGSGLLLRQSEDCYLLPDEKKLKEKAPALLRDSQPTLMKI